MIKFSEPTNNIRPKLVGEKSGWKIVTTNIDETIYVLCQVVGYPVPIFRLITFSNYMHALVIGWTEHSKSNLIYVGTIAVPISSWKYLLVAFSHREYLHKKFIFISIYWS